MYMELRYFLIVKTRYSVFEMTSYYYPHHQTPISSFAPQKVNLLTDEIDH